MTAGLREIAAAVGQLVAVEQGAFEVLGAWAPAFEDPVAVEVVARLARHHAWRAGELARQLVGFGTTTTADLTTPDERTAARLSELSAAPDDRGRLAAAAALLEHLARQVDELADVCTASADAALRRVLRFVEVDLRADRDALAALSV